MNHVVRIDTRIYERSSNESFSEACRFCFLWKIPATRREIVLIDVDTAKESVLKRRLYYVEAAIPRNAAQ